jgi:1,4-dihydroxy-2-naphthoate octaprenyltransferase
MTDGWRVWLLAIRPKTLPAAVAPIAVGTAVAHRKNGFDAVAGAAALVVALLLQIAANLANDLFDHRRGADNERLGLIRVTQSGLISERRMAAATAVVLAVATLVGSVLVWKGGWPIPLLGLLALVLSLAYTAGPFPLGYHGLGEPFVLPFFGFVGVAGSAYAQTGQLTRLASVPIGLLAAAIIVVNNLRDLETDRATSKRTLAAWLGRERTILEDRALLTVAFPVPPLLFLLCDARGWVMLAWLAIPLALVPGRGIASTSGRSLNPLLAGTARLTLLFSLLFAFGLVL